MIFFQGHWMLYFTPLLFFTGLFASYNGFYVLTITEWCLVLSSIYYWSGPYLDTYRRIADITVAQLSLYTHLYFAILYSSNISLILYGSAVTSYLIGIKFDSNQAHAFVWIFGVCANICLINHLKDVYIYQE